MAENTPFLADDEHEEDYGGREDDLVITAPANSHFVRPIKALMLCIILLSGAALGLLITSLVVAETGPFSNVWSCVAAIRDLIIVLAVNILVSTPAIFLSIPILINSLVHLVMSIVIFIFSALILTDSWPTSYVCTRFRGPKWEQLPDLPECVEAKGRLRIWMGTSAGVGLLIGILLLTTLLLRVVAIARTKPWRGKTFLAIPGLSGSNNSLWLSDGLTIQLTFKISMQQRANEGGANQSETANPSSRVETSNLIET